MDAGGALDVVVLVVADAAGFAGLVAVVVVALVGATFDIVVGIVDAACGVASVLYTCFAAQSMVYQ